jgi:predicted DNA-binding protein YlxM (UPF0122 family)
MAIDKKVERVLYLNELFVLYGKLLTTRQQEVFKMYYNFDLSLQEIADELKISKAAVSDNLKKGVLHLEHYEDVLHLYSKRRKHDKILNNLAETASNEQMVLINKLLKDNENGI